ncbi:D-isomer-specific 2-hydroxyacid dehydrogenase family protein [Patellaria atrata CBS 101060]|uniref:D-isomer-specific 2-hydroxyacid dehydrogenase family protein n=1 Tax=Patellaria atrata CBS 101060 TaxID=1346257 RepID=A0A9P4VSY9_9PEZI|nr:D-isomer-specific 2-hydroxyacid dehydrogenase family protein [Patellaria atrata CBS 101060]
MPVELKRIGKKRPTSELETTIIRTGMMASSKHSLAVLDDYANTLAPKLSHLSSRLDISYFPDTLNAKTPHGRAALIERLQPFSIISSMRERTGFPTEVIRALPNLKLLLTTGTRNAAIDLPACAERGIVIAGTGVVTKKSGGAIDPTIEHIWAMILALAKNVVRDDISVKIGGWQSGLNSGLFSKTISLLGLGRLGGQTGKIAKLAFGMEVVAWSNNLTQEKADEKAVQMGLPKGSFKVTSSKDELFRVADILSVHYVLSDRSRGIVGERELALMKKTALLVNSSRGPLIDQDALQKTLNNGKIRGAALDVFEIEPLPLDDPWRTTEWGKDGRSEVLLTPHTGYVEEETINNWYDQVVENIELWLDGKELNTKFALS